MDNASIHKTKEVQDVARRKGYTLLFTPPYTPEANPIEMVFGIIKNRFYRLRYDPTFESTLDAVKKSIATVLTPNGVMNTFRSSGRQVEEIARKSIL
jgi:transposase